MLTWGHLAYGRYLEVNDRFHRKVVEGTEPWVRTRTPDDAGALWLSLTVTRSLALRQTLTRAPAPALALNLHGAAR